MIAAEHQLQSASPPPRKPLREALWRWLGQPLMRIAFHNWYGLRRAILRLFGARLHPTSRVRPSATIHCPWNLTMGAHTTIGDDAIVDCTAPVRIGTRCTISQYAYICTITRDEGAIDLPEVALPIVIEDDAWIAADVFIGPGVTVGRDTVVGARSTVLQTLPPGTICIGDDARPIGPRQVRWPPPAPSDAAPGPHAAPHNTPHGAPAP